MTAANVSECANVSGAAYPIVVGEGLIRSSREILEFGKYSKVLAVIDSAICSSWLEALTSAFGPSVAVHPIEISESRKSVQSVQALWEAFLSHSLDRGSLILAIGGGVLCDVVGFAASTYMRGCSCAMLPTSLLAQVDAGVGGKTGVNFGGIKNLVGSLTFPCAVLVDVGFLRTLPRREVAGGAAEILKHGLIAERGHFEEAARLTPAAACADLVGIIKKSLSIKLRIVADDPDERGLRKILNFGHTLGHAFEAAALDGPIRLSHGEAVAIGMVGEAFLSRAIGLQAEDLRTIEQALQRWELPIRSPAGMDRARVLSKLSHDKKSVAGQLRVTLLRKLGEAVHDQNITEASMQQALDYIFGANQNM